MRAFVSPRLVVPMLVLLLVVAVGASTAAGAAEPQATIAKRAATHHKRHHANRALTCKTIRVRLVHHHKLHGKRAKAKAARCHAARVKRRHKRLARLHKRKAAQHRAATQVPISNGDEAESAAARGDAQGWNGYGAGSWPGGDWRPYADDSPFNQQIPADAPEHPRSAQMMQEVLGWSLPGNVIAGAADTSSDYGHPTYWAQPSDPLYTLDSAGYSPTIDGQQIRIPSAARPAAGGDGHMTVVEPDGWEYDLWQVTSKPAGGGRISFALGGRTRIDGDGLTSNATAARFGNLAGVIRAQELAAGQINHALFVVLKCASTSTAFGFGTKADNGKSAFVYPAVAGGSRCSSADSENAPPLGARFQLDMSDAQIAALGVPGWKKTILRALAHYGGYVGDTGGPGFGLQFESGSTYTSFGFADPLIAFAKQNGISSWNGTQYAFNLADGVDWSSHLRILAPPAS